MFHDHAVGVGVAWLRLTCVVRRHDPPPAVGRNCTRRNRRRGCVGRGWRSHRRRRRSSCFRSGGGRIGAAPRTAVTTRSSRSHTHRLHLAHQRHVFAGFQVVAKRQIHAHFSSAPRVAAAQHAPFEPTGSTKVWRAVVGAGAHLKHRRRLALPQLKHSAGTRPIHNLRRAERQVEVPPVRAHGAAAGARRQAGFVPGACCQPHIDAQTEVAVRFRQHWLLEPVLNPPKQPCRGRGVHHKVPAVVHKVKVRHQAHCRVTRRKPHRVARRQRRLERRAARGHAAAEGAAHGTRAHDVL